MATGDPITRANIQAKHGTGWYKSHQFNSPNTTYWVSAPVFVVQLYTNASGLTSNKGSITVYRWDGSGTGFTKVSSGSTKGGFGASNNSWKFNHNCTESASSKDSSDTIHLYKIVASSSGGGTKYLKIWAGGVNVNVNSNANTYKSGSHIYGCRVEIWNKGGTYSDDASFINGENKGVWRGTLISDSNSFMCYSEG